MTQSPEVVWLRAQPSTWGSNLKVDSIQGGVCMERVSQKSRKYSRQHQLLPARRETDTASEKPDFQIILEEIFLIFKLGKIRWKIADNKTYPQVPQGREATWPRHLCQHSLRGPGRDSCNKMWFVCWVIVCVEVSHFDCSHTGWF